jgi:thymidylate kinase
LDLGTNLIVYSVLRFWHSTTAYAFANFLREGAGDECYANEDLSWPSDLVQPNLVLFLTISEEERMRRHTNRADFTNTAEEKILASDPMFRENLKNCYKKICGVRFEEFPCEGAKDETGARLLKLVSEMFPNLKTH